MEDLDPGSVPPLLAGAADPVETAVLCLSLAVLVWAVVCQAALRNFRWTRLERITEDQQRLKLFENALKSEGAFLDSLRVARLVASIIAVLVMVDLLSGGAEEGLSAAPFEFLSHMSIVLLVFLVGVHGIIRGVARASAERTLLLVLPSVMFANRILMPVRWVLDALTGLCTRALGLRSIKEDEQARDEILDAVSEGEREGAIGDDEREMIESIIEFRDMEVTEIMTPRTSVYSIGADTPIDEAVKEVLETGHSRVPVHGESIDDVMGFLYAKDLLGLWADRNGSLPGVKTLLRKPLYVPETKNISELLKELRRAKVHIAVVLDEYGGMSGLVTMEDILEEIVGEIEDEYDPEEKADVDKITRLNSHVAEVSARIDIGELNEALALSLPDEDAYETLGGFLFAQLGRVPEVGESVEFEGLRFEILEADERRINRVRVVEPH